MPYTPEQNGSSERENRTLVEAARTMMHAHEQLPLACWSELVNTAAYCYNPCMYPKSLTHPSISFIPSQHFCQASTPSLPRQSVLFQSPLRIYVSIS
ncbi:unnamed protein product [Leptosia nina]|uniref:Integrase catalytic domain-containing protein n=1 Tax=Leptosia nina TaxID=320188 RepID=A0AAV1K3I5_9NEOP